MLLDKFTLNAQLAMLSKNAEALDISIKDKVAALQNMTIDLEHTRGARRYHDMIVQQVQNALAEVEREEKAATTPPATS